MSRKGNAPDGKRAKKRAKARSGPSGATSADRASPPDGRAAPREAAVAGAKPHRVFVESVPPAMVAEVFEVAGADDDLVLSSVPPPPVRTRSRPPRGWSRPPVPHPPHPPRPPAPAPGFEEPDALELAPDELEVDAPAPVSAAAPGRRAWFAVGGVALLLGVALGVRSCTAPSAATPPGHPQFAR